MTVAAPRPDAAPRPGDPFAAARAVADAVLYEGYLLYPYRRSSRKNRVRWQFGVLAPRAWVASQQIPDPGVTGAAESWFQQAECLLEPRGAPTLRVVLRFLQLQRRQVFVAGEPVDRLGDELSFDEALPREVQLTASEGEHTFSLAFSGAESSEALPGGRLVRTSWPVTVRVGVSAARADAPFPLTRLQVRVENTVNGYGELPREQVLRHCLIATHLLVGVEGGSFLSLLDPPTWASAAAARCDNRHVFPVLASAERDALLCAPILLYDYPRVAPESPTDLHDATEIDEILSLRTMALTDAEKREARATDPRAAAIVDRIDAMPPELLARLHGAVRDLAPARDTDEVPWWDPRAEAAVHPDTDTVLVAGRAVRRGSRVRLAPRGRADAHDMFLAGREATVHEVRLDVDGSVQVAVTVDADRAAGLHEWYGRFLHFAPEEIEPIGPDP